MTLKIIVIITMVFILIALGSGLIALIQDKEKSHRLVKSLTWRIALSLGLFIFLFLAYAMGWIAPHNLR